MYFQIATPVAILPFFFPKTDRWSLYLSEEEYKLNADPNLKM